MSAQNTLALIGEAAPPSAIASLKEKGFEVFVLRRDTRLAPPVSSHADMLLFCADGKVFLTKEYAEASHELSAVLEKYGYETVLCHSVPRAEYPNDILFNVAPVGKNVIGNIAHTDGTLKSYLAENGYTFLQVKQGYAKCSSAIINDNALITADKTIADCARSLGIDVLQIKNSDAIKLDGYDYGFIGGTCGYFDGTLYFCGDIALHPEYQAISEFCKKNSTLLCSLSSEPLYDVGSILFLTHLNI